MALTNNTITSANVVILISVDQIFPQAQQIQGFAPDRAAEAGETDIAELIMGVDGVLSAGFIPYMVPTTFMIMPDSPSSQFFETWVEAERENQMKYQAQGTLLVPSTSTSYTLSDGYLTRITSFPPVQKVLQARPFVVTWNSISAAPSAS